MTAQPRRAGAADDGGQEPLDPDGGPPAWDVAGADWLPVVGESLHRDALAAVVAPFPDRRRLTWAVLLRAGAGTGTTAPAGAAVSVVMRGRVVGWLPRHEAEAAAGFFAAAVAAYCPAVVTRSERGDWVVDLRVDRAVLRGERPPAGAVPVGRLHAD
jgi:hypothetical protein